MRLIANDASQQFTSTEKREGNVDREKGQREDMAAITSLAAGFPGNACSPGVCHGASLAKPPEHRYAGTLLLPWQLTGFCGTSSL